MNNPGGSATPESRSASTMSGTGTVTITASYTNRQRPPPSQSPSVVYGTNSDSRKAKDRIGDVKSAATEVQTDAKSRGAARKHVERNGSTFPTGRLSRSSSTRNTSSDNSKASGSSVSNGNWGRPVEAANERNGTTWTGSWSTLQNMASSVLGSLEGSSGKLPNNEDEEERRRERIAERRRRAGLDSISGAKTSAATLNPSSTSGSFRSRVGGSGDNGNEDSLRGRGGSRKSGYMTDSSFGNDSTNLTATRRRRYNNNQSSRSPSSTLVERNAGKRSNSPDPSDKAFLQNSTEANSDTLAYVHHVQPMDTLAGVAIKFNIQPASLRKANRLWSNDSIQSRKELLLPVEDCLVKGKPLPPEETAQNESDWQRRRTPGRRKTVEIIEVVEGKQAKGKGKDNGSQQRSSDIYTNIENLDESKDILSELPPEDEPPYRHESYVLIDGIGKVEIARLSRKKLTHFPPRRRKSISVSISEMEGIMGNGQGGVDSVFALKAPGVGVSSAYGGGIGSDAPGIGEMLGQVAKDTLEGVESVASTVEGLVRKFRAKVQDVTGHDLIELTQQFGFGENGNVGHGTAGRPETGGDSGRGTPSSERHGRPSRLSSGRSGGDRSRGSSSLRERAVMSSTPSSGGIKGD